MLADLLHREAQSVFYLKQLQSDCLPTAATRRQYRLLTFVSGSVLFGFLGSLLVPWQVAVMGGLLLSLALAGGAWLPVGRIVALIGLVSALHGALIGGPIIGLAAGLAGAIVGLVASGAYYQLNRLALRSVLWRSGVAP